MRIKSMGVRFQSQKDRESNFVSMACRARGLSTVLLEKVLRFFSKFQELLFGFFVTSAVFRACRNRKKFHVIIA